MFENRSKELEIMDDLDFGDPVVFQTLKELKFINYWLGGNKVSLTGINCLLNITSSHNKKLKIADLGSGGGDMMVVMAKWAAKQGHDCQFTGIDANQAIIDYARKNTEEAKNIYHQQMDVFSTDFQKLGFDIVTCTLFTHHFTDEALIQLFKQLKNQTAIGIVINDLHRHWLAYYSIKLLTSIFSRSYMVKFDAPLSVARAFRRNDWYKIFDAAGIKNFKITWKWAFRWQIVITTRS